MKDYKRLQVGAAMFNSPSGFVVLDFQEFDGGLFELHPKISDENSLVLVDPNRPATYGLEIKGDPRALVRLGAALQKLGRDAAGAGTEDGDAE